MNGGNLAWFLENKSQMEGILQDFINTHGTFYASLFVKEPTVDLEEPLTILAERTEGFSVEQRESDDLEVFDLHFKEKIEDSVCPNCGEAIDAVKRSKLRLVHEKNFVIVLSAAKSQEYESKLKFLHRLYPALSRIFLRSAQIQEVLKASQSQIDSKWRVVDFVSQRKYGQEVSVQEYPKENIGIEEAYRRANERETWVDSIEVKSGNRGLRLKRNGIIRVSFKNAGEVLSLVFNQIYDQIKQEYMTLISEEVLQENSAIQISLDREYFANQEKAKVIKKELQDMENIDLFPLTPDIEQPEYYLKDYSTGSVNKIVVASRDKILISPELYPSAVSIYKLLTRISSVVQGELDVRTVTQTQEDD